MSRVFQRGFRKILRSDKDTYGTIVEGEDDILDEAGSELQLIVDEHVEGS